MTGEKISQPVTSRHEYDGTAFFRKTAYNGFFNSSASAVFPAKHLQTKFSVSQPGDSQEQEADSVADEVMRMPDPTPFDRQPFFKPAPVLSAGLQRKYDPGDEEEEEKIYRQESETAVAAPGAHPDQYLTDIQGRGQALPEASKAFFEPRLGYDFSAVRIHNDPDANQSANKLNALAYTHGNNIVFAEGQFMPGSEHGNRLLAHELAHTVQQNGGNNKLIQRQAADYLGYLTNPAVPSEGMIITDGPRSKKPVVDISYYISPGSIGSNAYDATIKEINDATLTGLLKNEDADEAAAGDENQDLIDQLASTTRSDIARAEYKLIGKGKSGWISLLIAVNQTNEIIRTQAAVILSRNVRNHAALLHFIVDLIEKDKGTLGATAVRVLLMAGYGNYFDNQKFTDRIVQKLEFIKIFFGLIPLPEDGYLKDSVANRHLSIKTEIEAKADAAIRALTGKTVLWNDLVDIAQVVEIFQTAMLLTGRAFSFMQGFDAGKWTVNSQAAYSRVNNIIMILEVRLNAILSIRDDYMQVTASPGESLIYMDQLVNYNKLIPKLLATATVDDLMFDLYRVERDSMDLSNSLYKTKPTGWEGFVDVVEKVLGITNAIQLTLPSLSYVAWDFPLVYFSLWAGIREKIGGLAIEVSAIASALSAYSLKDTIEDSWQVLSKRSEDAKESKRMLQEYLEAANELIIRYKDDPKSLGTEIEKLRAKESYKKALDWAYNFQADEEEFRQVVMIAAALAITLISIYTAGLASGLATAGLDILATTGTVGAAIASNTVIAGGIVLAADTLGFVTTEKLLNQLLFGKGNWDDFLSDYVKSYLTFGVLKGTGKLFDALVASEGIPYGLAKISQFGTDVTVLTAMQGVFIAWDNLWLDPEHQKKFNLLSQLGSNALFLAMIKIGMLAVSKFPPPLMARLEKNILDRLEATSQKLENKLSEIERTSLGTKEAQALQKTIGDVLEVKRAALERALAKDLFKGDDTEIAAAKATIQAIGNRINEINRISALFKFNITPSELENVFTFEGDPAELKQILGDGALFPGNGTFERVVEAGNSEIYRYQAGKEPPIFFEKVTPGVAKRPSPSDVAKLKGITWKQALDGFWEQARQQHFKTHPDFIGNAETNIRIRQLLENGWLPGNELPESIGKWLEAYYTRQKPAEDESNEDNPPADTGKTPIDAPDAGNSTDTENTKEPTTADQKPPEIEDKKEPVVDEKKPETEEKKPEPEEKKPETEEKKTPVIEDRKETNTEDKKDQETHPKTEEPVAEPNKIEEWKAPCFVAGTKILLPDGSIDIEEITPAVSVIGKIPGDQSSVGPYRVTEVKQGDAVWLIRISIGGSFVLCTLNHRFFVAGEGWMAARHLKTGDQLESLHTVVAIEGIDWIKTSTRKTYNFSVPEVHTYFILIGTIPVLVHNDNPVYSVESPVWFYDDAMKNRDSDVDGTSVWEAAGKQKINEFFEIRIRDMQSAGRSLKGALDVKHAWLTPAQVEEEGLVLVKTRGNGSHAAAGFTHYSIRPKEADNTIDETGEPINLTADQIKDVNIRLAALKKKYVSVPKKGQGVKAKALES